MSSTNQASAAPAQDGSWDDAVAACRAVGREDRYVPLTEDEVRKRYKGHLIKWVLGGLAMLVGGLLVRDMQALQVLNEPLSRLRCGRHTAWCRRAGSSLTT